MVSLACRGFRTEGDEYKKDAFGAVAEHGVVRSVPLWVNHRVKYVFTGVYFRIF